jgi:hypothetical protein
MKSIIYRILLALFALSIVKNQTMATSLEEISTQYPYKTILIPLRTFSEDRMLEFIVEASKGNLAQDLFDDLEEEDKDFLNDKLQLDKRNSWFNKLSESQTEPILQKFNKVQNHIKKIQEISQELIIECLKKKKETLDKLSEEIFDKMKMICLSDINNLFIFVFPEAYFNFLENRGSLGNFIPYYRKEFWFEKFIDFSQYNQNSLLVPNIIYFDKQKSIGEYKQNFLEFIVHSYNQKNISENYYLYDNLDVTPIFNESLILFKGNILLSYKKRYILDEDIPLKYLGRILNIERLIYVPGISNQDKNDDFYIEICQDHAMITDKNNKSKITFIQSATISLNDQLLKNLNGLFIHADIDRNECAVFYKKTKKRMINEIHEEIKRLENLSVNCVDSEYLCKLYLKKHDFQNFLSYDVSRYM